MITITKTFRFEAAHKLPFHQEKCKNVHGHSYLLEIEVQGHLKTSGVETGMIMDFGFLSKIVKKEIIDCMDHKMLNDLYNNPTAEHMVQDISDKLHSILTTSTTRLIRVRLWETSKCYAEWKA